ISTHSPFFEEGGINLNKKFYNPDECMGFMTYTASRLLVASLHKHMTDMGVELTSEQWGLLMQFWNRGDIAQEEIARVVNVDKSTASRTLKVMERRGLIARRLNPADSRRKILSLTKAANTMKQASLKAVQATLGQALRGIDPEECATCLKVLGLVKKNLQDTSQDTSKGQNGIFLGKTSTLEK
ncbi:MAG: MarR family transcriptional regulator, partial [Desulfovibrio sp.]|nr:MarR family transcriptional regulator [Desulfovibrio sp.]